MRYTNSQIQRLTAERWLFGFDAEGGEWERITWLITEMVNVLGRVPGDGCIPKDCTPED